MVDAGHGCIYTDRVCLDSVIVYPNRLKQKFELIDYFHFQ